MILLGGVCGILIGGSLGVGIMLISHWLYNRKAWKILKEFGLSKSAKDGSKFGAALAVAMYNQGVAYEYMKRTRKDKYSWARKNREKLQYALKNPTMAQIMGSM